MDRTNEVSKDTHPRSSAVGMDRTNEVSKDTHPRSSAVGMDPSQQAAYDAIKAGKSIFLTGPGGAGKTYLLEELVRTMPTGLALTAMTGCAAVLLGPQAKTVHSWAGVGLAKDPVPALLKAMPPKAKKRWKITSCLVIDEVSMMTPDLLEKLDAVGRAVRKNETTPFGGIQLIFVGDFYQLPPITQGSSEPSFLFESPLWHSLGLEPHQLTTIHRQKDPAFQVILQEARSGTLSDASIQRLSTRMRLDFSKEEIQPTMLFTRRAEVEQINQKKLAALLGERRTFRAETVPAIKLTPVDAAHLAKAETNVSYIGELTLTIGAQVMLLINNPKVPVEGQETSNGKEKFTTRDDLKNGSRGKVIGFTGPSSDPATVPIVQFRRGAPIPILYHTWEFDGLPNIKRRQIPLRLAYAMTIHKSQGATIDCALIDVGSNTFEYGQAYVALSRIRSFDSLYIHDLSKEAFRAHPKVKRFYSSLSAKAMA